MTTPSDAPSALLSATDLGACPFCQQPIAVGETADGYAVTHGLPMCRRFERMPADQYISAVFTELAKRAPS